MFLFLPSIPIPNSKRSKQAAEDEVKALIARSTTEVNEHTTQIVTQEHRDTREFLENAVNGVEQRLRNEIRLMTPQRHIPSAVSIGDASTSVPDINRRESSSYIQTPLRRTSNASLTSNHQELTARISELEDQLRVYKTPAKCSSNFQPEETPVYHSEVSKIDEETRRKVAGRCMEAKKKANMPLSETSRPTTRSRARKQASKL